MSQEGSIPCILDTDIGDNVDDALALAFACRSRELNLLGVTTVYGDPVARAGLALDLLESLGCGEVPVAAGIGKPLSGAWDPRRPEYRTRGTPSRSRSVDRRGAADFLLEMSGRSAGPVTLCCIGPLTNLAVALSMDPTLARRVRIVLMGGMASGERPETNVAADPQAARQVLASGAAITMVGLDVTTRCVLSTDGLDRIRAVDSAGNGVLIPMLDDWIGRTGRAPVLHDPLAVAVVFQPDLCTLVPSEVTVRAGNLDGRAITVARASHHSLTSVATDVDSDRFLRLFLGRLCPALIQ